MGEDLYRNYINTIRETKRTMTLPQCRIWAGELLQYNCTVAYGDANSYLFIFPVEYSPQWVVTGENRYHLCEKHIEALKIRGIYAIYQILRDNRLIRPKLVNRDLSKFRHYHGDGEDCWGALKFPKVWDGSLKTLADMNFAVESALHTINRDSPMLSSPRGMPRLIDIFDKSTLEGKEGVRKKKETPAPVAEEPVNTTDTTGDPVIQHWGEGGQTNV